MKALIYYYFYYVTDMIFLALLPFSEVARSLATTTQPHNTDTLHHCWHKGTVISCV